MPNKFASQDLGVVATDVVTQESLNNFLNEGDTIVPNTPNSTTTTDATTAKPASSTTTTEETTATPSPKAQDLLNSLLGEDEENTENTDNDGEDTPKEDPTKTVEQQTDPKKDDVLDFSGLAKDLVELGILTKDDDEGELEIPDAETFKERWLLEKKKGAAEIVEAYLGRFGEKYEEMFDAVFVNGIDPETYLTRYARVENINTLDPKDPDQAEKLVRESLRSEGRNADYINKRVEKMRQYGEIEEEAEAAKTFLIEKENKQKEQDLQIAQQRQQKKQLERESYINNINKILNDKIEKKEFDGIPVTKEFAVRVGQYIAKEQYKVENSDKTLTEFDKDLMDLNKPENYELKVKVAMLLQTLKTDPTLSKLQRKAVSKESNQIFQSVIKKNKNTSPVTKAVENNKFFSSK